jgi:hypothetical protein
MVYTIIKLEGSSPKGWEDAVNNAVTEAAKTVRGIQRVMVDNLDCKVENNKIAEYRADVRISFKLER